MSPFRLEEWAMTIIICCFAAIAVIGVLFLLFSFGKAVLG